MLTASMQAGKLGCIDSVYEAGGGQVSEVALWRRLAAEFLGSAFLAAVVIGSGIAAAAPVAR